MAFGLGGLYGQDTATLGNRQVTREAMAQRLSSTLSQQMKARDVAQMPEHQWSMYDNMQDAQLRGQTVSRMRAMEGYNPIGSVFSQKSTNEI